MKRPDVWLVLFLAVGLLLLTGSAGATTPDASFTANSTSGGIPLSVQFIDTSSYSPTSWTWSFGDGGTSTVQSPVHTYIAAGTYTVTLTTTNADGSDTRTRSGYISLSKSATAPVALFITNTTSGSQPFAVQFVDSSSNSPTGWAWSFGDGGTSTEQNPVHTYSGTGTFTVTLTAVNRAGSSTVSKDGYITVAESSSVPDASFEVTGTEGTSPFTIQFIDTTTNSPTSWIWSFGDGTTSTAQNPSHTYTTAGTYTVTMTATNSGGSSTATELDLITVEVTEPISSFEANVTSGLPPLVVQFTDTSANSPTSWYWSFGNGETSTEQDPVNEYDEGGSYTVVFTATNSAGSNTTSLVKYITVTKISAPVTSFTADSTSGAAPLLVQFTDTSTNSPTAWEWTFGDGSSSTLQNPSHTYTAAGSFSVVLTATNAGGSRTATTSNYIAVTSADVMPVTTSPAEEPASATTPASIESVTSTASTASDSAQNNSGSNLPVIGFILVVVIGAIVVVLLKRPPRGPGRVHRREL